MAEAPPRPLPQPTPLTRPFWDAARAHRLLMPRTKDGRFFWYPRALAPGPLQEDWEWAEVSGRGAVYSFTIDRRGSHPSFASMTPYVIAIVELDEGPRMTTNIVGCPTESVHIGMRVEASFDDVTEDTTLVMFRPRAG